MTLSSLCRTASLTGVSVCALISGPMSGPVFAQDIEPSTQTAPEPVEGGDEGLSAGGGIIVQGQRLRGALDVEQAPLLELGEEEIAAEGVASIADLVTQITAQTGSSRGRGGGGRPIILVNGIRPGSFRELFQYPPEALEKLEVFPEEVAQRFGFAPDRRVINLILKDNYRNAEVEFEFEGPTRGGYYQREQELGFLQIANGGRFNVNLEANDTSLLTEDERDILQTPGSISDVASDSGQAQFRSLIADSRSLEANVSWAKAFLDSGISVSANANYERNDRLSLQGLNTVNLTDASGDSVLRTFGAETPLENRTASDFANASGSLTTPVNAFRLTSTFNAGLSETTQVLDRQFDASDLQASALAGTLALDGALPTSVDSGTDTAFTRAINATSLTTLRGPLGYLPGGEVIATFDVGYNWERVESDDTRSNLPVQLTRGDLSTGANLVIPITSRREGFADALGSFTLNAQIGAQELSDFGTLGDYTLGLTWSPFDNLDLSANYIVRDVAPGVRALGNPQVVTENVFVFDFVNGETVLAEVTTGGNPDLLAETQRDWKFAANWQLPFWDGARFQVEYIRNRSDDVVSAFPQVTEAIEAAFPDRITRDAGGTLVALDRRQVSFAETRADRLNFSLNLRGSIGGAAGRGGRPGAGRPGAGDGRPSGRPSAGGGGRPASATPSSAPTPPTTASNSGPPGGARRAAFMQFREQLCADDGLQMLTRLASAIANGEDVSATLPGMSAERLERMVERAKRPDGTIDEERLAIMRTRICAMDPSAMRGGRGGGRGGERGDPQAEAGDGRPSGAPGAPSTGRPAGPMGEGFAAFRNLLCAEDGEAQLRALVARIDRGEDVSDVIPGFDPNMAGFMLGRLRGDDGELSSERIAGLKTRLCSAQTDGAAPSAGGAPSSRPSGGPPGGFNPLARNNFSGFRYFVSLNHTIQLENEILIAPGLDPLDQLDGQSTNAFGLPRHTSRLEAGIFGAGVGMRLSGRYTGSTRIDGSGLPGSSAIFFDDLATFNLRVFGNVDQLTGSTSPILKNVRVSLRLDNVFDAQLNVVDANGDTPINFQPFLIDPVGRFVGIDIRKLF